MFSNTRPSAVVNEGNEGEGRCTKCSRYIKEHGERFIKIIESVFSPPLIVVENLLFKLFGSIGINLIGDTENDFGDDPDFYYLFRFLWLLILPFIMIIRFIKGELALNSAISKKVAALSVISLISVVVSQVVSWKIMNNTSSSVGNFIGINYSLSNNITATADKMSNIICMAAHGVTLQPYWILIISTLAGQFTGALSTHIVSYVMKFLLSKESFTLKKPSQLAARISKLKGWMQLYSFITIAISLNVVYGPSVPPSDPALFNSAVNSINGTTRYDVTWITNYDSHLISSAWRSYEQLYMKYLCGGVGLFMLSSYSAMDTYKEKIFDQENIKYLKKIDIIKITIAFYFLLPALYTHIIPVMLIFPHYSILLFTIWWSLHAVLEIGMNLFDKQSWWTFMLQRFQNFWTAFIIALIFQTFFTWGVSYSLSTLSLSL